MHLGIFDTPELASQAAAQIVLSVFERKPNATIGVATGSSPEGLYAQLRAAHAEGDFTLENSKAFALDEYVGLPEDHYERYRNVLRRELVGADKTGLLDENLNTPNGLISDSHAAAASYDAAIQDSGGVDIQILGIGSDGHIGFNEPSGSLVSRTHVEALAKQTVKDNARFFDDDPSKVPATCITQGLGTIMEASILLLVAFGENKAEAIAQLAEGPISAKWPATIMQMHPEVYILTDAPAASRLEFVELYKERWQLRFGG
ncbi:glucosamine-6-phosphate deaminase [Actinomycetaceae bacterium L2_0104]